MISDTKYKETAGNGSARFHRTTRPNPRDMSPRGKGVFLLPVCLPASPESWRKVPASCSPQPASAPSSSSSLCCPSAAGRACALSCEERHPTPREGTGNCGLAEGAQMAHHWGKGKEEENGERCRNELAASAGASHKGTGRNRAPLSPPVATKRRNQEGPRHG